MPEANTELPEAPVSELLGAVIEKSKGPSIKDQMITIAMDKFELGRNKANNSLFGVHADGPNVALPLGGPDGVMSKLGLLVFEKTGKTPSSNANGEVKRLLEAKASQEEAAHVPIRTGRTRECITIDMGSEKGEAIEVKPSGWEVVPRSSIVFARTNCTSPMVYPVRSQRASGMRRLFNVSDDEWEFLVNWQALALVPDMPHVMPILEGEPGSAKTTTTRMLIAAVDPSKGELNAPPKDQEALDIAASGSWVFALENVSNINAEISDALARLITGAANRKRELYSDGNIHIREMLRVVVLNGVSITGLRSDVLDRSVTVRLVPPTPAARLGDDEVAAAFESALPAHLALLLDTIAGAMKLEAADEARLVERGRMASFEQWLEWCDKVRGTATLQWYRNQRKEDIIAHATEDIINAAICELANTARDGKLTGTASEIRGMLMMELEGRPADLRQVPPTPRAMTNRFRMHKRGLEEAGWEVTETVYANSKNAAKWSFRPFVREPEPGEAPPL